MRRVALLAAALVSVSAGAAEARIPVSVDGKRFAPPATGPVVAPGRPGSLVVVRGHGARTGSGPVLRYAIEVEGGLPLGPRGFAARVHAVLGDRRSWGGTGRVSFERVSAGPTEFRVVLARPATVDGLCAPLPTNGWFSCAQGARAVLNVDRWLTGSPAFPRGLEVYRRYVVNHEVGHLLGHGHSDCPAPGAPAPVMMQQTKGVGACRANAWPLPSERG